MIRLPIPICPHCGKWFAFRSYKSLVKGGQKRAYVTCKNCGWNDVIVYFDPKKDKKEPISSEKGSF